jgi:hypothetical protein
MATLARPRSLEPREVLLSLGEVSHSEVRLQLRRLWEAGFRLNGTEVKLSSPFATVRYPDGAWELTPREKVPNVGDMLWRCGGKWIVSKVVEDASGHVIVTWRRAPQPQDL